MSKSDVCGISVIITATGMKRKDILAHIEAGRIQSKKMNRQLVFDYSEKIRLETMREAYIGFFGYTEMFLHENHDFSPKKQRCRNDLAEFMEANSWYGIDKMAAADVFFTDTNGELFFIKKSDMSALKPHLQLWFDSYGETAEGKFRLLLGRLRELYPKTTAHFTKFTVSRYPNEQTAALILADFLYSTLNAEITQADNSILDNIAERIDKELPLNSARIFSDFLIYLRSKRKLGNGWSYHFQTRGELKDNDAYPAASYFKMAYVIFNEDAWNTEHLREKAFASESFANMWLFTAFHFICGWRGTDIIRVPMPILPYCGEEMRLKLADGCLNTDALVDELEFRMLYNPVKPNKTSVYEVPDLKLSVAESLRKPFGFIFALAASYHENVPPGGAFIRSGGNVGKLKEFFGDDFLSACGNRGFNTRRANKSYLQGIEAAADDTPGKPKGYMLAAIARSHKGGYGALPQTTEIYLRDARFSGYSPEFIARQMFERGVFSFIPALLLDIYEGNDRKRLTVSAQTKLIAEIGISPTGLEGVTSIVQCAYTKARQAVSEILARPSEMRPNIEVILQNIASGNAPGRQDGMLCLMTAAGFVCTDLDRSCCIGCGFEIYTKTILRLLMSEYSRLLEKKKNAGKNEADRCETLLKQAVLPAISEILLSAERLYPNADMKPMLLELERGLGL